MPRPALICLAALLSGCTNIPEIDTEARDETKDAEYPRLVPLEQILDSPSLALAVPDGDTAPRVEETPGETRS